MIRRTIAHRRNRRQTDPSNMGRPADAGVTADNPTGSTATLAFTLPVSLGPIAPDGDPGSITCGAEHLVSVAQTDSFNYTLTFSGAVSTNDIVIPPNCPTFRTAQGGYAQAGTYPTS